MQNRSVIVLDSADYLHMLGLGEKNIDYSKLELEIYKYDNNTNWKSKETAVTLTMISLTTAKIIKNIKYQRILEDIKE